MAEDAPSVAPVVRRLNLIPVGLKEAALDSPTFRATATHFGDQVDVLERWLDGYVKTASKLVVEVTALEPLVNTFLSHSTPPQQISEAILDHDYTLLAMRRYADGARDFWQNTLRSAKRYETNIVEPIRSFMNNEMKTFKEARRSMDTAQKHFDNVISRYLGQSRTKEASSLREDAFQLHEARKAYLKTSMDLCVLAPQLRNSVDKLIVKVFTEQWKDMRVSREATSASFTRWSGEMERVRGWSREMENSERAFKRELTVARKQIEDSAEHMARPSRELDDYAASTVPYLGTGAASAVALASKTKAKTQDKDKAEKQGWLFLRTITGRPPRTTWSRRWFFVKNGIFGWLVQGLRSGGVEESEKIGVLLCNVRPAFQEERRFCFEVKTSDASIVLQAETQQELTDWISAFEVAKRKALEDPASTEATPHAPGVDPAFAISPPVAPEFAAKPTEGHASQASEDGTGLLVADRDLVAQHRASFDVNPGRRAMSPDKEADGTRERLMQKLDLHKRSNASLQTAQPPALPTGGIASLISASHNVLPLGPGAPQATSDGIKRSFTVPSSSLAPSTLANPPAPTNLSHTAVVVSGERGVGLGRADGSAIPSGILANLWGSSNWAYVNRLDDDMSPSSPTPSSTPFSPGPDAAPKTQDDSVVMDGMVEGSRPTGDASPGGIHRKTVSVGTDLPISSPRPAKDDVANEYPNYYPVALKAQNAQFRMLFPQVPKSEKVVLVFRATWNPNEQQEFPGRVYVTAKQIYFFSNHLGLVLITSVRLKLISEVTAAPGRDCDFLYLHMKDRDTGDGHPRITVKIFLEPLKLLQRRLNFLVENAQQGQSDALDLEGILKRLIKLEVEVPKRSSSVESWEDVAFDTNEHGELTGSPQQHRGRNYKASLRIDGNIYGDPAKTGREIQKFKLPAQPVRYAPQGMQTSIARDFNISAKALFHVIFGDKSAVFQVLYCNRWADKVEQTPWVKSSTGHWTRSFASQDHATPMADTQTIDIYNDHLCYVVTNTKYPWRFPYADSHTLVTKFVITHSAKSRAKLAIFQSVKWARAPTVGYIKHLIERESLNALEADALDLTTVAMDQVTKLGNSSKTNKSIDIFGGIGVSQQAAKMDVAQAPDLGGTLTAMRKKQRAPITLYRLVRNDIFARLLSFLSMSFDIIVAIAKSIGSLCTAHTFLVGMLLVSGVYNTWHGYRDGVTWYQDRTATRFMKQIGVGPSPVLSKAIYLADIHDIISTSVENDTLAAMTTTSGVKTCRTTFGETLASSMAPMMYPHAGTRLSRARDALAKYRHDLLVALRVVNRVEKDVVLAEWEEWVRSEERNCRGVERMMRGKELEGNGTTKEQMEIRGEFESYCNSCRKEMELLKDGVELI